jgi:hypothetical protein
MTYTKRTSVVLALVWASSGCGGEFDATFEPGDAAGVFGTLIDDRGEFEFLRNPDTGNIQSVESEEGTLFPPTDGQDLSVERATGGSVTLSPVGENDVLVAVRNDEVIGSTDLSVPRSALGGLGELVPPEAPRLALQDDAICMSNQGFVDAACSVSLDLDEIADGIHDALPAEAAPPTLIIRALLGRYLDSIVIDCCLAWNEFRDNEGDACDGA